MSSESSKPTVYERLGGVYSIAAVVDDFIDRVMHNPVLNANAAVDEAHHRVSAAGFKYYVTEINASDIRIAGYRFAAIRFEWFCRLHSGHHLPCFRRKGIARLGTEETAAPRDFNAAYDRFGSKPVVFWSSRTSHRRARSCASLRIISATTRSACRCGPMD